MLNHIKRKRSSRRLASSEHSHMPMTRIAFRCTKDEGDTVSGECYTTGTEADAELNLELFAEKWHGLYLSISKSW